MKIFYVIMCLSLFACVREDLIKTVKTSVSTNQAELVSLAAKPEKTIVVFWRANCGPCINELTTLNDLSYPVVAINVSGEDLPSEIKTLSRKLGSIKPHIVISENRALFKKLNLGFVPFSVVVENQKVTNFYIGFNDKF